MSLSKKYIYVHKCSLAQNTPDNFRKVLGRAWVPSERSGMQYGYDVQPPVMDMTFGPYMEWAHDYFYATEMPATTQIVSIKPNPHYFPPVEQGVAVIEEAEAGPEGPFAYGTGEVTITEPCCGWYAYLGAFFADHFSDGNPLQVLRSVLDSRVEDHKLSIQAGLNKTLDNRHFPGNSCGQDVSVLVQTGTTTGSDMPVFADAGDIPGASDIPDSDLQFEQMPTYDAKRVRLFKDLWFQMMTPFSELEDSYAEGKEKALASDLRFNYNFFLDAYERQLRGDTLPEIRIPNLYLTIGQDGSIPYVLYLQNNVKCRFKDFERLVLQSGYREYLVPVKQQPWVQDKNIYATSFPMDAKISFGTDRSTFVADALEDSKMECNMLRRCSEGAIILDTSSSPPRPYTYSTEQNYTPPMDDPELEFFYAKRYYDTLSPDGSALPAYAAERSLRTFDFYQWALDLPDLPSSVVPLPNDHIFLGNQNDSTDMALKVGLYQNDLSFLANYFIMSGKINEIARIHLRNYQQMMRGDNPHSETILYRISKYSTSALNREFGERPEFIEAQRSADFESLEATFDLIYTNKVEPIQNIWIPNSNSIDIVEYVDTQIKYNKGYTYTVTAYELSVGTEYFYSQYFGKNPTQPQPEPEICSKVGVLAAAGPYGPYQVTAIREHSWMYDIINDSSLSEGEKYQAINDNIASNGEWVSSSSEETSTCEGTAIAIIRRTFSPPNTDNVIGEWAVLCYCFDLTYDSDQWTLVADLQNTAAAEAASNSSEPSGVQSTQGACTIYTQLETYLKAQVEVVDPSDTLISQLQQLGITSLPEAEVSGINRARFRASACPDGWTQGAINSFTREIDESVPIGDTVFEAVYLGQQTLDAVCECPPPEPCRENFLVTTFPSLKVHEVPYMMWGGRVTDSHPVGPDVEINPYRSNNKEMLFEIGAGLGDYYGRPVAIYPQEQSRFRELLRAQKSQDGTVLFRSDDPVQNFEMFMLTDKPTRYTDFSKGVRTPLSVRVKDRPGQMADAVSTIQKLEANKKYYYIFRSIDVHGHVSNPTPIYEVELVDSDGAIYPLINIFEPDVSLPIDLSKNGQRLLQIRPEYLQSSINETGSGLVGAKSAGTPGGAPTGEIKLGNRDKKLWDKKFKLRLTSCETRRMLDINLKFKTEHVDVDDCQPPRTNMQTQYNQGLDVPDDVPRPGEASRQAGRPPSSPGVTMSSSGRSTGQSASRQTQSVSRQTQSAPTNRGGRSGGY